MTRCARAALVLLLIVAPPASAHLRPPRAGAPPPEGLLVPGLTHGQMAVIAENLDEIERLADAQMPTDPVLRRLQGYVSLQSFACLWGLVPGSIGDETSPFNECAHAYLAGAQALFLHLRQMPGGNRPDVQALGTRIEMQMLDHGASLVMCRYSDEPFSTGEILPPRWRGIPTHLPSLLTFAALTLLPLGATAAWTRVRHRAARRTTA
jgi:hypothetical protein